MNTIRAAGIRYRLRAAEMRLLLAPSHHARRRARSLGLTVDIQLALRCPQRVVSVVPLPVLDLSSSPALSPLDSLSTETIPARNRSELELATEPPITSEKLLLSALSPFFLPSDPFEWILKGTPDQLSSRFSVSPMSPVDIPSVQSYGYVLEGIHSFRVHTRKELPEVSVDEMDQAWDFDMAATTDMCFSPNSSPSGLSPVSVDKASSRANRSL